MSIRRLTQATTAALCAFAGMLLLANTPALAREAFFQKSVFGATGSGDGQFSGPRGVAVDRASGDVYVADTGNYRIERFDAKGNFLAAWGWGVSDGASSYEVCVNACQAGVKGAGAGQFSSPIAIAVDNSPGASKGDVYVADGGSGVVEKFDSSGKYLSTIAGANGGTFTLVAGVAVDPAGNVWVEEATGGSKVVGIDEFGSTGVTLQSWQPLSGGSSVILQESVNPAFTVDANDNVYLDRGYFEGAITEVFSSSGLHLAFLDPAQTSTSTLGANLSTNLVFEGQGGSVAVYDATLSPPSSPLDVFGSFGRAAAVASTADDVYIADQSRDAVYIYAPEPPTIVSAYAQDLEPESVDLATEVGPNLVATSYHFEYGPTTAYGNDRPVPEADLPIGAGRVVTQRISGLQAGREYHFRVVARNAAGATLGQDNTFVYEPRESCPNEQFRTGYSANLPDCRAYELVSVAGTEPYFDTFDQASNIRAASSGAGATYRTQASISGERIAFYSSAAPPGTVSDGPYYMATRTAAGWSTEDLIPPESVASGFACFSSYTPTFSADLAKAILADGWGQDERQCGREEPLLVAGEPRGFQNLFVRNSEADSYQLVDVTPPAVVPDDAWVQTGSADLSHVVFEEEAKLTPQAPVGAGNDLFEWANGVVRFVTILPDGTPVRGTLAATHEHHLEGRTTDYPTNPTFTHAVSADGSRVFFYANGNLYVREHADREQSPLDGKGDCVDPAKACTAQVDAAQAGGPGGGATFMWASADGSKVFFTDDAAAGLTSDTVAGSAQNLYQYDVETGQLTDLTPAGQAAVLGVSGTSEDGSYVYFVAEGVLSAAANSAGRSAIAGQPNLYLRHGGVTTYIATLTTKGLPEFEGLREADDCDWSSKCLTARVSPNGAFIGFNTTLSLTGYDNGEFQEIFLYDAAQNKLSCVSCDPTGVPATGPAGIRLPVTNAIGIESSAPATLQRQVLDDGRVFFDTIAAIVPVAGAGAGESHVYEYQNGRLHMISAPTGGNSYFFDADPSGDNAFFVTALHLVSQDQGAVSLYDARVDGGFPEPASPTACSEEDCKGTVTPSPLFPPPSSATFVGAGNVPPGGFPAAPVAVKQVAKHTKKKHTKKKHTKKKPSKKKPRKKRGSKSSRAKRASRNRGGSK